MPDQYAVSVLRERRIPTCIWGNGTNLSAEHILPQWLHRMVKTGEVSRRTVTRDVVTGEIHEEATKQGSVFTVRPRVVCEACNNGWMSRLEESARPILTPLVQGTPTVLSSSDLTRIASWTMKTAIVAQYAFDVVTTKAQCQTFREVLLPVPGTKMWIGRFGERKRGNVWTYAWPWIRDVRRGPYPVRPNSHLSIFAAGRLLLLAANSPDPAFASFEPKGLTVDRLMQFWPNPEAIRWPPRLSTTDEGVLQLREAFAVNLNMRHHTGPCLA